MTSGQSNLTTGRITAAHGWFSGICQVAVVCTRISLGQPESKSQTASQSVAGQLQQTDRQTTLLGL